VAVSKWGMKANADTAPTISILPLPDPPAMVRGLEIRGQGNDWQFYEPSPTFIWRERGRDGYGKELDNDFGAGSGARGSFFSHYDVEILSQLREPKYTVVHSDKVQGPMFQYLFDMNREDHGDYGPQRSFRIRVRAADIFNQQGPWAWLDAYNLEPTADVGSMRFGLVDPNSATPTHISLGYEPPDTPDIAAHILLGMRQCITAYDEPFQNFEGGEASRLVKIYAFSNTSRFSTIPCPEFDTTPGSDAQNRVVFTWVPVDTFGQTYTSDPLWDVSQQGFVIEDDSELAEFMARLYSDLYSGGFVDAHIEYTSGIGSHFGNITWWTGDASAGGSVLGGNLPSWYGIWRPVD